MRTEGTTVKSTTRRPRSKRPAEDWNNGAGRRSGAAIGGREFHAPALRNQRAIRALTLGAWPGFLRLAAHLAAKDSGTYLPPQGGGSYFGVWEKPVSQAVDLQTVNLANVLGVDSSIPRGRSARSDCES